MEISAITPFDAAGGPYGRDSPGGAEIRKRFFVPSTENGKKTRSGLPRGTAASAK